MNQSQQLTPQLYWRCAHYPSAIDNFFEETRNCGYGCHLAELKWYHNGVNIAELAGSETNRASASRREYDDG